MILVFKPMNDWVNIMGRWLDKKTNKIKTSQHLASTKIYLLKHKPLSQFRCHMPTQAACRQKLDITARKEHTSHQAQNMLPRHRKERNFPYKIWDENVIKD